MSRPSKDQYFMDLAIQVATRATCPRKHVGCVLVREGHVLATGYNGSMVGEDHCDDVGCDIVEGHCVRTVHAEANALAQAARHGTRVKLATAYITAYPCWGCFKLLANAGIQRVIALEAYRIDTRVVVAAMRQHIDVSCLKVTP